MIQPYYQQDGITIYHGDCRDVLDEWEGLRTYSFDLLLTDPPYGIRAAITGSIGGSNLGMVKDYGPTNWDNATCPVEIATARGICRWHAVFGGNYYDLPPARCWLVWDKDNTAAFADCELIWTNFDKAVRMLTHRWNGMLQQPGCSKEVREHPTQKPEPVIRWILMHAPQNVRTVLDPFMGSGTTLVAAKRLGKHATGIEREERYCEIAAKRLSQGVLSEMFA